MAEKGIIKGYPIGANITLVNALYIRSKKMEDGKYSPDYMYLIYRDLDTNEKKFELIEYPYYRYYLVDNNIPVTHARMYIEKKYVHPVECNYIDLKKSIAKNTNNIDWFYDNIRSGNYKANDRLFRIMSLYFADMNIEDFYRFEFDRLYKNDPYTPTKLYFDIETDIINIAGDFPEPGEAPVNAVTVVDDDGRNIYVLLLEQYDNPLIYQIKDNSNTASELKEFVKENVGGWKNEKRYKLDEFNYKIVFFQNEIDLIKAVFKIINTAKPDFALAWNIAFDLPYLIARIQVLGYNPLNIICSPEFPIKYCDYYVDRRADKFEERGDFSTITSYTVYLDQLITFASRRKGQRAISRFNLDYVGQLIARVRKLDYSNITTKIADLPRLDYKVFVFYNVMDTIVQLCIERKTGDVDFVFTKALSVNTRYSKVHRQTVYLVNRGAKDFYDMGYIIGNNHNKNNSKETFSGAFVGDPLLVSDKPKIKINGRPINILLNLDDFD